MRFHFNSTAAVRDVQFSQLLGRRRGRRQAEHFLGLGIRTQKAVFPKLVVEFAHRLPPALRTRYLDFRAQDVVKNAPVSDPVREAVPKNSQSLHTFCAGVCFRSLGRIPCCFRPECGNFAFQFHPSEIAEPAVPFCAGLQLLIGLLLFYLGSLQLFLLFHKETALQLLGNMLIRIDHENQGVRTARPAEA